jgi:hypothetical protein
VGERERESWRDMGESEIQPDDHSNQPNEVGNSRCKLWIRDDCIACS